MKTVRPRIYLSFCLCLPLVFATCQLRAQDEIQLRDERTGRITTIRAVVVAWDSAELIYRGNGRESRVAGSRVVGVQYARSEEQINGDLQFDSGKFAQAMQSFENAAVDQKREWIKIELAARQLQCASAMNRQVQAIDLFLGIVRANPRTRHFHLIPLAWQNERTDGALAGQLAGWLSVADENRSLIAASWLLSTSPEQASARLKELSRSEVPRIAHLANAQLWRTRTIDARAADTQRWQRAIDRMPRELRPGPHFLLNLARKRLAQTGDASMRQQALIGMMQVPILFPAHYQLSGSALLEASQILERNGRKDEAARVLAELFRDYSFSNAAFAARGNFENMDQ